AAPPAARGPEASMHRAARGPNTRRRPGLRVALLIAILTVVSCSEYTPPPTAANGGGGGGGGGGGASPTTMRGTMAGIWDDVPLSGSLSFVVNSAGTGAATSAGARPASAAAQVQVTGT